MACRVAGREHREVLASHGAQHGGISEDPLTHSQVRPMLTGARLPAGPRGGGGTRSRRVRRVRSGRRGAARGLCSRCRAGVGRWHGFGWRRYWKRIKAMIPTMISAQNNTIPITMPVYPIRSCRGRTRTSWEFSFL